MGLKPENVCLNASDLQGFENAGCVSQPDKLYGSSKRKRLPPPRKRYLRGEPLLGWRSVVRTPVTVNSRSVENLHSPQHDNDGRKQRGRRQYFQGSDSHTPTPLPAPIGGLVDSLTKSQLRTRPGRQIAKRLCFVSHTNPQVHGYLDGDATVAEAPEKRRLHTLPPASN